MKLKAFITLAQWLKNNSDKNKNEVGNKNKEIKRSNKKRMKKRMKKRKCL